MPQQAQEHMPPPCGQESGGVGGRWSLHALVVLTLTATKMAPQGGLAPIEEFRTQSCLDVAVRVGRCPWLGDECHHEHGWLAITVIAPERFLEECFNACRPRGTQRNPRSQPSTNTLFEYRFGCMAARREPVDHANQSLREESESSPEIASEAGFEHWRGRLFGRSRSGLWPAAGQP